MFSQLPAGSVSRLFLVVMSVPPVARVMLMELFGAIRTFEFMAFARHARKRHGHDKQGEKFHRRAS